MHRRTLGLLFGLVLVLLGSCGQGQQAYLDRVQPLPRERAHPLLGDITAMLPHPGAWKPDDLVRTWKAFLGDTPVPLHQGTATTFVYYDFTGTLNAVYLEASFAPKRLEPLERVGSTGLFLRTYDIFRQERALYRFSDGKRALPDPFNATLDTTDKSWQRITAPDPAFSAVERVVGASESGLGGQDLTVLLPKAYDRNLAWTYPFLVVVGLDGLDWTDTVGPLLNDNLIRPVLVFSVGTKNGAAWGLSDLRSTLETRVIPWIRENYRVSKTPADLTLVGWASSAKVVQDLAASRPDFWTKTWTPAVDPARSDEAWTTLAPPYLKAQFGVVPP